MALPGHPRLGSVDRSGLRPRCAVRSMVRPRIARCACARSAAAQRGGLTRRAAAGRGQANPGLPTRAHLAAAMVAEGIVARSDDAFKRYLKRGRAAHIAADWPALEVVVGWIRAAGGSASLAHPARYDLSAGARRQAARGFRGGGRSGHRSDHGRQRGASRRGLRTARDTVRPRRDDRLGFPSSRSCLESLGPVS
jgi:predicted metal-dependent phosphoesterase TrpH